MRDHTKTQKSEISKEFYNEFLTLNTQKKTALVIMEPFSSSALEENVSTVLFESMAVLSDAEYSKD